MRDPDAAPGASSDDAALVARARRGDRRAFDLLVVRHSPQVWKVVWRIVRHREDAEDVVQEVFVTAYRTLAGFRGDAKLSTWLHRIAVTRALNHTAKAAEKVRRASEPLDAAGAEGSRRVRPEVERAASMRHAAPTPVQAFEGRELMRRLAECLQQLPGAWRAILALRDAESLAYEEIASILRIELGTVRSRLARARASLKECVEGDGT